MAKRNANDGGSGDSQITELVYQALETELGGVEIYRTALTCVQNDDLREEWEKYLAQTENHVVRVRALCESLGLDPDQETPGRQVVRFIGKSLVKAMHMSLGASDPAAAEIVAAECVVLAETKDHGNWSLLGRVAKESSGAAAEAIASAHDEVEDEEDEHLYHTKGWMRELWIQSLGLNAQIPPPEEKRDVKSAVDAAVVEKERDKKPARSTSARVR